MTAGDLQLSSCECYLFMRLNLLSQVVKKRLWKHVYDQMGGSSNYTSAATGTRRNYEKLVSLFFFLA